MTQAFHSPPQTLAWIGEVAGHVRLIDQTRLPTELVYRDCRTVEEIWEAIRSLRVRGAPAIGIAAAMGAVLGMQHFAGRERGGYRARLKQVTGYLRTSRPTDVKLICDSMAAQVMKEGRVHLVITGADRIAANGDTANKIGTYGVALLAHAHGIPFYVAAPSSSFDLSLPTGEAIPIEQRDPREVTHSFGRQTAPDGIDVYNPAFDVTPHQLIAGIVTEK